MSDAFSQIYIHIVFAVKGRKSLINTCWEEQLYQYISGIVSNKGQLSIAINGMPDHIHILIGMKPTCCLSDLVRGIKKASNIFINEKRFLKEKFEWQNGFGAFSYRHTDLDQIVRYIRNQKEHHKRHTFKDEYHEFLEEFNIEYKDEYLFEWVQKI